MSPEEIIEIYDRHPDLTLRDLARLCGWTVKELKILLMGA